MLSPKSNQDKEPTPPPDKSPTPEGIEAAGMDMPGGLTSEPGKTAPPQEPLPSKPPKEESRTRRFFVRAFRWLLGFLIVFGLGMIFAIQLFYNPLQDNLHAKVTELNQAQQDITSLQGQISSLENRIAGLEALETKNQELQQAVNIARLHTLILSAQADVAMARLALVEEDITRARLQLNNTSETLDEIEKLVTSDQQQWVQDMRDRLDLALSEMDETTYAAILDLEVLATRLLELENAYFTSP